MDQVARAVSKRPLLLGCSLLVVSAAAAYGCAQGGDERVAEPEGKASTSKSTSGTDPAGDDDDVSTIGETKEDPTAKPEGPPEVWGQSSDTLYKLDPKTKAVTVIGKFQGCTSVIDIALDENSNMVGTTKDGFYSIDKATAKCTEISKGTYPTSLSFVPKGTVDDKEEALVGFDEDVYVRIDKTTGKKSSIGSIGDGYRSSGDIVSVKGGATYLTVTGGPKSSKKGAVAACDVNDCLLEIDPSNGKLLKNLGSVEHKQVFGLTFWGGVLYGFSNGGDLFEITVGSSVKVSELTIPERPSDLAFWGAGSSTAAPLVTK